MTAARASIACLDGLAVRQRRRRERVAVGGADLGRATVRDLVASCWNSSFLATKSVSQLSSISAPSTDATRPLPAVRSARLPRPLAPLMRSSSTALSKSPSASSSAFLQSIIPAPVASRSRLTSAAVKFAMVIVLPFEAGTRGRSLTAMSVSCGCGLSRCRSVGRLGAPLQTLARRSATGAAQQLVQRRRRAARAPTRPAARRRPARRSRASRRRQQPRRGPSDPRRPRRRSPGSAARPSGSRRRCPGSGSRPRRDRSWCRGSR